MHLGYRIVGDMIDGLSEWLDEHGMKSVRELVGRAVPAYKEWGDLDLSYKVVAKIDARTCIGCQRCVVACNDGAHQCIFTGPRGPRAPAARARAGHGDAPVALPRRRPRRRARALGRRAGVRRVQPLPARLPRRRAASRWQEVPTARARRGTSAWRAGAGKVPGGIHDSRRLVSFGRTFALAASGLVAVREYGSSALLVS